MNMLFDQKPKRIFTFGCSFTDYIWATWANILGYEFKDAEFYNYGKSGAGNFYISNMITQVDCLYNFQPDDLVIVSWTNVSREDRYLESKPGWLTPGNIYSQGEYDNNFVKQWANDTHFVLRDYSLIALVYNFLKNKTQFHFLSMCNISYNLNQWDPISTEQANHINHINELYETYHNKINLSFYESLWNNDIENKWKQDWKNVHKHFSDGHPLPLEHLTHLQNIFDYEFSDDTIRSVNQTNTNLIKYIQKGYRKTKKPSGIYEFSPSWHNGLNRFKLRNHTCPSNKITR